MSGEDWNETLFDGFPEPVLLLREEKVPTATGRRKGIFPASGREMRSLGH